MEMIKSRLTTLLAVILTVVGTASCMVEESQKAKDHISDNVPGSVKNSDTWTVSDTGQTSSYTAIYGEDNDYSTVPPSFTDNGNQTVTDNNTGLVWQKEDNNRTYAWKEAGVYCSGLALGNQEDWRLPTRRELMSIVDYGTFSPTIDATYFPKTNSSHYWSSTISASYSSDAWRVYFGYGYVYYGNRDLNCYVRCVRGG